MGVRSPAVSPFPGARLGLPYFLYTILILLTQHNNKKKNLKNIYIIEGRAKLIIMYLKYLHHVCTQWHL